MAMSLLLAAAAMAHVPAAAIHDQQPHTVDVAYEALASGDTLAALEQLESAEAVSAGDAARLINLGTAYARLGRTDDARRMFRAALASGDRSDLELADGRWVSTATAARMALAGLDERTDLAMR